jgi:hypothetical protein
MKSYDRMSCRFSDGCDWKVSKASFDPNNTVLVMVRLESASVSMLSQFTTWDGYVATSHTACVHNNSVELFIKSCGRGKGKLKVIGGWIGVPYPIVVYVDWIVPSIILWRFRVLCQALHPQIGAKVPVGTWRNKDNFRVLPHALR